MPRILVIDDDTGFTNLLAMNLKLEGQFDVEIVNDPRKAHREAVQFKPDLILLDVVMPHLDGGDILTLLKAEESLQNVPIILITALVGQEDTAAGLGVAEEMGVIMLAKTCGIDTVVQVINRVLAESAQD